MYTYVGVSKLEHRNSTMQDISVNVAKNTPKGASVKSTVGSEERL